MKKVDTIARMSTLAKMLKGERKSVSLVPTMGCIHDGHLSLVRAAKKHADVVVMSIFVNPIQFGPKEDFKKYPRDPERDGQLAEEAGVDIIFCPSADDMYPDGFGTYVNVEHLTDSLCGASRPGHFRGVTTVVAKLFGIIKPDMAYFGQKDAQQAIVVRKMVRDLNMGVEVRIMPIVRERDGLAMSSRNMYLTGPERADAAVLNLALEKAAGLVSGGERDSRRIIKAMKELIAQKPAVKLGYVSVVDTGELRDLETISGEALIAVAATVGKTRLIDNVIVKV